MSISNHPISRQTFPLSSKLFASFTPSKVLTPTKDAYFSGKIKPPYDERGISTDPRRVLAVQQIAEVTAEFWAELLRTYTGVRMNDMSFDGDPEDRRAEKSALFAILIGGHMSHNSEEDSVELINAEQIQAFKVALESLIRERLKESNSISSLEPALTVGYNPSVLLADALDYAGVPPEDQGVGQLFPMHTGMEILPGGKIEVWGRGRQFEKLKANLAKFRLPDDLAKLMDYERPIALSGN